MPVATKLSTPLHEEATSQRLVRIGAWAVCLIGLTVAVLLLFAPPIQWSHVAINFGAGLVGAAALLLSTRGAHQAAAQTLIWGVWVAAGVVVLANGGMRSPNLLNYPVIVVFAGWVVGTRSTLWLVVATAVYLVALMFADQTGRLPEANFAHPSVYLAYYGGILLVTASATLLSRRSYQQRVNEARQVAADLRESESELRKLLRAVEQSPESVVITDLQGRIEYVNDAFLQRTHQTREEVIGRASAECSNNGLSAADHEHIREALTRGDTWSGELSNRRKDGSEVEESVLIAPIRQPDGVLSHFVELKQDITERRRAAAEIHRLANFDPLTGLPNRRALLNRLDEIMRDAGGRAPRMQYGILLLDLDRFTTVNDARGNQFGDRLLQAVAHRLQEVLPDQALLVRVAADEFALVLKGEEAAPSHVGLRALAVAQALGECLGTPLHVEDADQLYVGASIGITVYPRNANDDAQSALQRASTALHRIKQAGGGGVAFFEEGMGAEAEQRYQVERELRQAIKTGQLRLFLQSQLDDRGNVVGAEALVRWQHPERGLLTPAQFITIAEQTDLIISLDAWVLSQACALLATPFWRSRPLQLSVNLSVRQFRQADFVSDLREMLPPDCDPSQLTLEVTESLVIEDFDATVSKMHELGKLGVKFSLDDFGTGYSSLAYLKRLPIHEIKIDKSFVHEAPTDADDAVLIEGILSVARHFGLRVVAEGVETAAQARFLRDRAPGVICQGYLFARPEPLDEWMRRLENDASAPAKVNVG